LGALGKVQTVLKSIRSIRSFSVLFILFMTFIPVNSVQALMSHSHGGSLPLLDVFVSQIKNGRSADLRGIYIPEILAARVVQQPIGNNEFVSPRQNVVTQFELASQVGSTGLLAHNYLAGESFSLLKEDQKFYLIYGDGQVQAFVVTEILHYQALQPTSALSELRDLENGDLLTSSAVFSKVYDRPGQVIFQTCISMGKILTWGRLFVIAEPYSHNLHTEIE
jgi:hypothetical protein